MNLEAKLNVPAGWPDSIARQIRFAAVNTVNKVAVQLQSATVSEVLPHAFTLRSRGAGWWQPRTALGFNLRFANRKDAEPRAILGSRADWLPLQEEGGTKTRPGHRLAIPIAARPSPTSVIPRARKPRRLVAARKGFVIKTSTGGLSGIFERVGSGPRDIRLVYLLEKAAEVKSRLQFEAEMERRIGPLLESTFAQEFRAALATMK
jgi:hypothetical protein